jgi:hypothetical protein
MLHVRTALLLPHCDHTYTEEQLNCTLLPDYKVTLTNCDINSARLLGCDAMWSGR